MPQTLFESRYPTYEQSQKEFLVAAEQAGAGVEIFPLANLRGRFGEPLSIDTAYLGPPDPSEMLVLDSGIHGNELFGSAVKLIWILRNYKKLNVPKTMGVLLIHALNPHGASFLSRYSSGRIDLSRIPLPPHEPLCHPHYELMYDVFNPKSIDVLTEIKNKLRVAYYICKYGRGQLIATAALGQRKYPKGVQYSGILPAPENLLFRQIVRKKIPQSVKKIVWINLHIGLADQYGESLIITEFKRDHPRFRRCENLFGRFHKVRSIYEAYCFSETMPLSGAIDNAIEEELNERISRDAITAFCLEVGTYHLLRLMWNIRKENWWHHYRRNYGSKEERKLREETVHLFYPYDAKWRKRLVHVAQQVVTKSIEGLHGGGLHAKEQRRRLRVFKRRVKKVKRKTRGRQANAD